MSKLSSLITLVHSLSKSEQKKVTLRISTNGNNSDYAVLFKIIDSCESSSQNEIKLSFQSIRAGSNFNTAVNYLYEVLLSTLSELREKQDSSYMLFNQLMYAKVLFEKSLYGDCFELLLKIQKDAVTYENFTVLLIAQRLEHDYLLGLDFPDISESELLGMQYKMNDTLKKIRKINEHAFLYGLLKHRLLYRGLITTGKQKQSLNDLVVSEMSIVSSSGFDNFEIEKTHKLFQSNYLIAVGDYKSALHSFYELSAIFEQNKHLLSNPPIYYLDTIEGVLESLRIIKNYDAMPHFVGLLEKIESSSTNFTLQVKSVIFIYTLVPYIDRGDFVSGKSIIDKYREDLIDKINMLVAARKIQVSLYISIVHLGLRQFSAARKSTSPILNAEREIFLMPVFRAIRLINLLLLYELADFDLIEFEVRSIKRHIKATERTLKIEKLLFKFVSKPINYLNTKERIVLWNKTKAEIDLIIEDKYELQLLQIFDFSVWIESKIKNQPLDLILKERLQELATKNKSSQ